MSPRLWAKACALLIVALSCTEAMGVPTLHPPARRPVIIIGVDGLSARAAAASPGFTEQDVAPRISAADRLENTEVLWGTVTVAFLFILDAM